MVFKLLAVGDIHLGRQPSQLPVDLAPRGRDFGPAAAWDRLVERAIVEAVDLVALAGDVVEREEDFYEAGRQLRDGVGRLVEAGMRVVGVAGNHDVKVLPRLAREFEDFHLLGWGGSWESRCLEQGNESVTIWGWSFSQPRITVSPLAGQHFDRGPGVNLGLLHCDRDQSGSVYGPVTTAELHAACLDGWLLGHIHRPDPLSIHDPIGYLGSVSGLDPGETGEHGPWLLTIERGRIVSIEQWVLAPLRYEQVDLDITELDEAENVRVLLGRVVAELDMRVQGVTAPPDAVALRVRLCGHSRFAEEALCILKSDVEGGNNVSPSDDCARYFIERFVADVRPEISLDDLARRHDPAGLLARRLLLLEDHDDESGARKRLIEEGRKRLQEQAQDLRWQGLAADSLDDAEVVAQLRHGALRLLDQMLRQQNEPS